MKRILLSLLCVLLLSGVSVGHAMDSATDQMNELYNTDGLRRAVPQEAREAVQRLSPEVGISLDDGIQNLWGQAGSVFRTHFKSALRVFLLLLVTTMLIGLVGGVWTVTDNTERPLLIAGVLAVALISFGDFHQLVGLTATTGQQLETFSKTLLPIMSSMTAASGAPSGAVVRQAATMLFSDVLITTINRFLIPCTYAYLAVITADAALGNQSLTSIGKFLKWGISGLLKLLLTLYIAYLSISGVVAGSSDAMLEKGTKFAISGMVPVVGGIISEATQTIVASASLLKSAVGVFGLLAVLGVTMTPLIRLGLQYLLYRMAAAVCAPAAPKALMEYIEKVSDVFGLLLGMTVSCSFLLLISIVSCMQAGIN